jgi:HK97 gp10 family phage protein
MGEGLASFQRRMRAIPEAARDGVKPSLIQAADMVADAIRDLAPVDEGDLRASIAVTGPMENTPPYSQPGGSGFVPDNMAAVTVGNTNVRYAHLVEYGTSHSPAQPFFWPGFRLTRKRALISIKAGIGRAIRKAGK